MTAAELRPLLLSLPRAELLELVHDIQDVIDDEEPVDPGAIEKWILEEVQRREEEFEKSPDSGLTWEQVEHNILSRHAARQKQPS